MSKLVRWQTGIAAIVFVALAIAIYLLVMNREPRSYSTGLTGPQVADVIRSSGLQVEDLQRDDRERPDQDAYIFTIPSHRTGQGRPVRGLIIIVHSQLERERWRAHIAKNGRETELLGNWYFVKDDVILLLGYQLPAPVAARYGAALKSIDSLG